jgi:opacity protein-like surface antigen
MKTRGIVVALLSLSAFAAQADTPFYAGGGIGVTDYDQQVSLGNEITGDIDISGDAMGVQIFAGIELDPRWALEIGYLDFGTRKESVTVDSDPIATFKYESRAAYLNGQYHIPVGDTVSVDLSAGWAFGKAKASLESRGGFDAPASRDDYSDNGLMLGLGVTVKVTELVYLRATGSYFDLTYDEDGAGDFTDEPMRLGIDAIIDF